MKELGWENNQEMTRKLKDELAEINGRDEAEYWLWASSSGNCWENEHNLLVAYLCGCCAEYDQTRDANIDYGDFPDIDTDFVPKIRDILKKEYAPKAFGEDKVCDICTYTKFGIRSALIDMARVLGLNRKEILDLTTSLNVKDDEGEVLTWDKALELYDDLREYLEKNPELAEAAKKLLDRVRGIGVHASGLIISGVTIKDFVPLVMPKQNGKPASAWVEGLSGTDLGAVGLVKFDFLGLDAQLKVGQAAHYAKKLFKECRKEYLATGKLPENEFFRKQIKNEELKISALPGKNDWTDLSYLDDPKALAIGNRGDLKMVFQFDGSPGIRSLAKEGGVRRFEDLSAYTSLYRPGPMKLDAHTDYCKLNQGEESPNYHPDLHDILGPTMGIMIFQEQIMKILHKVGKIPMKDCEAVRKAISKKKVDKFIKYKDAFIENGQKTLKVDKPYMEHMWQTIEAFAGYGFNLSHATGYSYNSARELFLKAHVPEAYIPSYLDSFYPTGQQDYDKMKEYLNDAKRFGIKVSRTDINESRSAFRYGNGRMYYSFNKIKGIGDDASNMIEQKQPYEGFKSFLENYGTDAKVCQALVALGIFGENRKALWEYYEHLKKWKKKQEDGNKRYIKSSETFNSEVERITGVRPNIELSEDAIVKVHEEHPEGSKLYSRIRKMTKRFIRVCNNHAARRAESIPQLDLSKSSYEIEDERMAILLDKPIEEAEKEYLGFVWSNRVEEVAGITQTFEDLDLLDKPTGPVEVLIEKMEKKKSAKGTTFYSGVVIDAMEAKKYVTIWDSDYNQFQEELMPGNIVRIWLQKPDPKTKYRNYTMKSVPRWKIPEKNLDNRVHVIQWRESK